MASPGGWNADFQVPPWAALHHPVQGGSFQALPPPENSGRVRFWQVRGSDTRGKAQSRDLGSSERDARSMRRPPSPVWWRARSFRTGGKQQMTVQWTAHTLLNHEERAEPLLLPGALPVFTCTFKNRWQISLRFPRWLSGKESAAEQEIWVPSLGGESPGGGQGNPLQYSCWENPPGQRCLAGYRPWDHQESNTMDKGLLHYWAQACRLPVTEFLSLQSFLNSRSLPTARVCLLTATQKEKNCPWLPAAARGQGFRALWFTALGWGLQTGPHPDVWEKEWTVGPNSQKLC